MGNGVSSGQGNLPSYDKRDVSDGSADREQYDWSEQAEAPETNTLLADIKPYSSDLLYLKALHAVSYRSLPQLL